ncbi:MULTISPECIES: nuclease-related domain-containing protein [Sphingomonas]|uniref:nuclease-related domain-containing protein n=1 Tax=Sphingomonas TaxID=13687 RepID=UPI0009F88312|nr:MULTISPECIES: nuclease-related domain-containing protein [Sphingomonas]
MIVKHTTKADECADFAAFIASSAFDKMPERVRKAAFNRRRGAEGERSTAHILDRYFHNKADHVLLHDLRLADGIGSFAQFDHVILSRLSRTASIIEVKNYSGRLSKNEHNEWVVWYGQRRPKDIPNPIEQAERQKEVLRAWLKACRHDLAFEKVAAFVIIPPDCSIDRSKIGANLPIYKADNFIAAWAEFGGVSPFGRLFSSGVAAKSLMAIAQQLAASHQPDPRTFEELVGLPSRKDEHPSAATVLAAETASAAEPEVDPPSDVDLGSVPDAPEEAEPTRTAIEVVEAAPVALVEAETVTPVPSNPIRAGKASAKIEVVPGIHERALPDGRIAFLSDETEGAGDRLKSACDGLGRWNPRYRNWLTDPDQAAVVRETLLTKHRERSLVAAERSPTAVNQQAREA